MRRIITPFILLSLIAITQVSIDIYVPALPTIIRELNTTTSHGQMTLVFFLIGFAVMQPIYGFTLDRTSKKYNILIGLGCYVLATIACMLAQSIFVLSISRFFHGCGAAVCAVGPRALIIDLYEGKQLERLNIYQSLIWSIVPITAPVAGGFITQYLGWRYNFFLLAVIAILSLISAGKFVRSSSPHIEKTQEKIHMLVYIKQFITDIFIRNTLLCPAVYAIFTIFNIEAPIILQKNYNLSPSFYGLVVLCIAGTYAVTTLIISMLNKINANLAIKFGSGICAIVSAVFLIFSNTDNVNLFTFILLFSLLQAGLALIFPFAMTKALAGYRHASGKASSLFILIIMLFGAFAAAVTSHFTANIKTLSIALMIVSLFIIIINQQIIWRNRK